MKRTFFCLALLLTSLPFWAQVNEKPFVIPEVTQWEGATGEVVPSGRVVAKSKAFDGVARQLVSDATEMKLPFTTLGKGRAGKGDVVLQQVKDKTLGKEGYRIDFGESIVVSAATKTGAFWATRTLLQMGEQHHFPKGLMTDVPQYGLRGCMVDCGRKFIPMPYLRNLVKIMAYYKMNALQVHLNDNGFKQYFGNDWTKTQAAFRLECDTYPGLTAKDGSYTKKEFTDLQLLGEDNCVEVIPEIDVPAHSLAFTQYMPEIASKDYGMDHLDIMNPKTYEFVDALFKEYLSGKSPVFRSRHVNIGTDEYSNATQELVEKFRYFTDRYIALMESYGKAPMLWGGLTHAKGTTPVRSKGVLMGLWSRDYTDPVEMKQQGFKLVSIPDCYVYIVPAAGYYYDYLNTEWLYKNWTPAHTVTVTFDEQDPSLEGGMFAVWNDHYGNGISVKDIHHRLYPALQTMSTKCWTGQKTSVPYTTFNAKRLSLSEAPGVNELGRLPLTPLTKAELQANSAVGLPVSEAGYDYAVSFDVDCANEDKGTVGFKSDNAVFYLADPLQGRLGFARDGYLNTFGYKLPASGKVSLRIEGNNRETRLFVNDKLRETLREQTLYAVFPSDKAEYMPGAAYQTDVYRARSVMHYQRTLFFPLKQTGSYKSHISNLKVEAMKDKEK